MSEYYWRSVPQGVRLRAIARCLDAAAQFRRDRAFYWAHYWVEHARAIRKGTA